MKQLSFLALALLLSPALSAQPPDPPPDGPGWRRSVERVEQLKKVRLVELLDLNEEQSVRFFARLNDHDNVMKSLGKEKNDGLDRVERLVRNAADPAEIEKAFPAILAVDEKIRAEREKFFSNLGDLLTAEQRARFLLFERQFERELREAMREARRHRYQGGEPE